MSVGGMTKGWFLALGALALLACAQGCGDDLPVTSEISPTPNVGSYDGLNTSAGDVVSSCGPYNSSHTTIADYGPNFLRWTPDGDRIIFDHTEDDSLRSLHRPGGDPQASTGIYFVDAGGARLRMIVDANPGYISVYGTYADVSPDGKRIAYASCEYSIDSGVDYTGPEWKEREQYEYEIVTRNLDGSDPLRLTENFMTDHYPVWSPEGSRIAFVRTTVYRGSPLVVGSYAIEDNSIVISSPDGSDQRKVADIIPTICTTSYGRFAECSDGRKDTRFTRERGLAPSTFSWSPDGRSLAFESGGAARTVGADGSNLTQLSGGGMVTEAPAWSPDGSLVAFGRSGEHISDIVVSTPDGSDQRAIAGLKGISLWTSDGSDVRFSAIPESTDSGEQRVAADLVASSIAWSPDGSEIRFVGSLASMDSDDGVPAYAGIFSVGADGADMRIIAEIEWPSLVSWSPDGSRFAVRIMPETFFSSDPDFGVVLYTLSSDGSDKRILVRRTPSGKLAAESEWKNVGVCSDGSVVPDPQDNPGLVRDCEVLLRIRDVLAGDAALNWSFDVPITEWQGLVFHPSAPSPSFPLRVRGLNYQDFTEYPRLTGILPAELGDLEELEMVIITHQSLVGEIPSELGNLSNLRVLDLGDNGLTGEIPSELGNLQNLWILLLSGNDLMGRIPLALSGIGKDLRLFVRGNSGLTGSIPLGIWYFADIIDIRGTSITLPPGPPREVCTDVDFSNWKCPTEQGLGNERE